MDQLLRDLLLRDEGFRASAYTDSLGYWTIGIGRCIDARKGGGITPEEASYLLSNDIRAREAALDAEIPWWKGLDRVRRVVLLSMAFQMGLGGLFSFRKTLFAVREGRFSDASEAMLASRWASQAPGRVTRLAEAMRTGEEGAFRLDEEPPPRLT